MFEMLAGYPPFYADTPLDTCKKVCPRNKWRFVDQAMAKVPCVPWTHVSELHSRVHRLHQAVLILCCTWSVDSCATLTTDWDAMESTKLWLILGWSMLLTTTPDLRRDVNWSDLYKQKAPYEPHNAQYGPPGSTVLIHREMNVIHEKLQLLPLTDPSYFKLVRQYCINFDEFPDRPIHMKSMTCLHLDKWYRGPSPQHRPELLRVCSLVPWRLYRSDTPIERIICSTRIWTRERRTKSSRRSCVCTSPQITLCTIVRIQETGVGDEFNPDDV